MNKSKKESINHDTIIRVHHSNKYHPMSLFQIDPDQDPVNGGCIFIILEVDEQYAYGYIPVPGTPSGKIPYKLKIGDGCFVGMAKMYISE